MALIDADYKWLLSTNKLGGAITATPWQDGVKHDLYDKFTPAETTSGGVFYRAVFLQNKNSTLTMEALAIFIDSITPSPDTEVKIGLAPEAKNSPIEVIANETTAPTGVTFSTPTTVLAGLNPAAIDLLPDDYIGVWIELTVDVGAGSKANDGFTLAAYAEYAEA